METKQERLEKIEEELKKLFEEKYSIEHQIAEESASKYLARVLSWGLDKGSKIILFAKSNSEYHWNIAKTLNITDIDIEHQYFDAIEATYHEADYEYFVKVDASRIYFSILEDIEQEFNVYIVDESQVALLNQYFCDLKLTYSNYKEYEEEVSKTASMSIKIPV